MDKPLTDNATSRFTGLAAVYARSRPDYPPAILDYLQTRCGLTAGATVVDIASGTGISTRWLAQKGWRVIGIEPNDDMRCRAQETPSPRSIIYQPGTGEATGLARASADAVTCAQAFHWLAADAALAEFERILKPGGWAVLFWNERDATDAFTADFGRIIRARGESARMEDARQASAAAFVASPRFLDRQRVVFAHEQALDEESIIGRALSMSHAPRAREARDRLSAELGACFQRWQIDGRVTMRYETSVYTGKKWAS
jgi:SAM-dependent methyltransferase